MQHKRRVYAERGAAWRRGTMSAQSVQAAQGGGTLALSATKRGLTSMPGLRSSLLQACRH